MQPDLPWNVAGIPPEAREAARAAARREGLSVGEWLTRKILRTLSETAGGMDSPSENWRNAAVASAHAYRTVAESAAAATRDTEDMLARVSRSEDESQSATKRIEEHLKGVARRLDSAERSQAENNRAMSKAAAEINVAAREQAQAFDQLDGHVMQLAERLNRVEQGTNNAGLKDAVKGLHTGLARLADQIAETANHSATQITSLAQNVESLAGRLAQARAEAEANSNAIKDHLAAVESRVAEIEKDDGASKDLNALRETLEGLGTRIGETEAQTGGAVARLQDSLGRLQSHVEDSAFSKRLANVEVALSELGARNEDADASEALREEVRQLSERLDAADRRYRRDITSLRDALEEADAARTRPAASEPAAPPPAAPMQAPQPMAGFDLPPFPQNQPAPPFPGSGIDGFGAPPRAEAFSAPPFDPAANFSGEQHFSGVQAFDTVLGNGFDAHGMNGSAFAALPAGASAESYIAATRRQARAAAAEAQAAPAQSGFSWSAPAKPQANGSRTRAALIGGVALIALGALGVSYMFLQSAGQPHQPRTPAAATLPVAPQSTPALTGSTVPVTSTPDATATPSESDDTATAPEAQAPTSAAPVAKPKPAPAAAPAAPEKTAAVSPMDKLVSAAKAGSPVAETVLGLKYLDGDGVAPNEAEGGRWLERAAKQGQPIAEYRLGTLYERGHGVPADPKLAATWYEAAARAGNRKAMHNLAVAYAQGAGVTKNFATAAQWFENAAELGLRDSQFNLAVLYERGMGVPQNLANAYKWYSIAAAQGDSESKARVAALSTQLKPEEKAAAEHAAATFKPAPLNKTANVPPTAADL